LAEYGEGRKGYLSIKEAAVRYEVSRGKVHRLIQSGRLETQKDPRDRRVTLLRPDELDRLLNLPGNGMGDDMNNEMTSTELKEATGWLTGELRSRVDALRLRVAGRTVGVVDSTAIIREERERRSRELDDARASG